MEFERLLLIFLCFDIWLDLFYVVIYISTYSFSGETTGYLAFWPGSQDVIVTMQVCDVSLSAISQRKKKRKDMHEGGG